jgi:hypothetical protein
MPFDKDPGVRESDKYCSLCFKNGKLCFKNGKLCFEGDDLKEFQKVCYKSMKDRGMNPILASFYTWCIRFAPRWKK